MNTMRVDCWKQTFSDGKVEDVSFDIPVPSEHTYTAFYLAIVEYILENYITDVEKDRVIISWGKVKAFKNDCLFRFTIPPPYVI